MEPTINKPSTLHLFFRLCAENKTLIFMLTKREIASRYKETYLGVLWSFLTPLFLIAIFSFVFTTIMDLNFKGGNGLVDLNYPLFIFLGISVHSFFSETLGRMNTIIIDNSGYVKKIFFHTELLILVQALAVLFHFLISLILIIIFDSFVHDGISINIFYIPIILFPFFMTILGFAYLLSCIAVFYRDLAQITGSIFTGILFCSTAFYPISSIPIELQTLFFLNPITVPIEQLRLIIFYNSQPNLIHTGVSYGAGILIFGFGLTIYNKYKGDFIDVI